MMKQFAPLFVLAFVASIAAGSLAAEHAVPPTMQERSMQMNTMLEQAAHAKMPAERQRLMEQHMGAMQQQMAAMHAMMTKPGDTGGHDHGGAVDPDEASRMQMGMQSMMQKMMEMMQMMMEHHPAGKTAE